MKIQSIRNIQHKVKDVQNLIRDRIQRMKDDLVRRWRHEPIQMSIWDIINEDEGEEE